MQTLYPPPSLPSGPPVRPARPSAPKVEVPASARLVWVALVVGLLCDLALRSGTASVGGALLVVGVSAALLASGRLRTLDATLLVAAAPLFGMWLAVRTSDWLLPLDGLAAVGLLVLGTSLSSGGSFFDLTVPAVGHRLGVAARHWLSAPSFIAPAVRRRPRESGATRSVIPAVRGGLVAAPILFVLGTLLASADAVFASFFAVDVDADTAIAHGLLVSVGAWTALGLLRTASGEEVRRRPPDRAWLGRTELTVILGSVVTLFGAFALSQLLVLSQGEERVQQTTGLTYAEYARSGFFQLLWVAALTVGLLLSLRAVTTKDAATRRRFVTLAEAVVVLTLAIVLVAIRRLGLYQDAFGLTMLRLYCTLFALWVGAVILGLGALIAGVGKGRSWLPGAATLAGLTLLFGLNVANPEALVARHNLERLADGQAVDSAYLAEGLSLDAVPTIVDRLPTLDPFTQADLLARIGCPEDGRGWAGHNASRSAAAQALDDRC